jgi:hypothetical protein
MEGKTVCSLKSICTASFAALIVMMPLSSAIAGHDGLTIKVRAQNTSIDDTPQFCPGIGPGLLGDRLDIDVTTDASGAAAGVARFEDAYGNVTEIAIDRVFVFFGGLLLQNAATQDAIPIWFGETEIVGEQNYAPAHINVELPRGCLNTVSTFTIGQDKVTLQIKSQ